MRLLICTTLIVDNVVKNVSRETKREGPRLAALVHQVFPSHDRYEPNGCAQKDSLIMKKQEYTVSEPQELLEFLMKQMADSSRTKVKELLAHNVYVDGRRTSQFNFPLQKGMRVSIEKATFQDRLRPRDLDIVYEDQHLFVVNKHEGLLSYSKFPNDKTVITVLNQYLSATHQKCHAHIVHRLDRDTSGLMVVSKSKEVSQKFEEDWKGMVYDRRYVAVAWGKIEPPRAR